MCASRDDLADVLAGVVRGRDVPGLYDELALGRCPEGHVGSCGERRGVTCDIRKMGDNLTSVDDMAQRYNV